MAARADNYNRTNSASTMDPPSDAAGNYTVNSGTWGINTNTGQNQSLNSSQETAGLTCDADGDFQLKLTVVQGVSGGGGTFYRSSDDSNHFVFVAASSGSTVYRKQAGSFTQIASSSDAWSDTDVFKVTLSANTHTFYKNGTHLSSLDVTGEAFNNTAVVHGLRDSNGLNSKSQFDDFVWTPSGGGAAAPHEYYYRHHLAGVH